MNKSYLILCFISLVLTKAQAQSLVVIDFLQTEMSEATIDLIDFRETFLKELEEDQFTISPTIMRNDAWKDLRTKEDKREYVIDLADCRHSIELKYEKHSKRIKVKIKDWSSNSYISDPYEEVPIKVGSNNDDRTVYFAMELARDVKYFLTSNQTNRPEIAIDEFESPDDTENSHRLMAHFKQFLPFYYLNSEVSDCIKLKPDASPFFNGYILSGRYTMTNNSLKVIINLENDGEIKQIASYPISRPIPTKKSDFRKISNRLISNMYTNLNQHINCNGE